jgi:hypothetical protein
MHRVHRRLAGLPDCLSIYWLAGVARCIAGRGIVYLLGRDMPDHAASRLSVNARKDCDAASLELGLVYRDCTNA